jgi:hypothetical protein
MQRNQEIISMIRQGIPYQQIADAKGISKQRVSQINQEYQEVVTDDAYRELQRTRLEYIQDELFKEFTEPVILVNARGPVYELIKVNTPDGPKMVQDFDKPVYDRRLKLEIIDRIIKTDERIAKLFGLERGKQRDRDQSAEQQEFLAYVQQLMDEGDQLRKRNEELARQVAMLNQPQVIEAEVIHEESPEATRE